MPRGRVLQNRLACDRCHSQKLRCQRQDGQGSCLRCARADVACIFSPRQRRTFASRDGVTASDEESASTKHQDVEADFYQIPKDTSEDQAAMREEQASHGFFDITMDSQLSQTVYAGKSQIFDLFTLSDWPNNQTLNVQTPGNANWPFQVEPNFTPSAFPGAPSPSSNSPHILPTAEPEHRLPLGTNATLDGIGNYVRQLADLNVGLYEHFQSLPPVTLVSTGRTPSMDGRMFAIDETFRMTQSLVDILKKLYPPQRQPTDITPDQGTALLIMSCTNRVFDIYEVIFGHMRGCIQHKITPVTADGKTIRLPELRIGSYSPPTPSAIAMHMLLVLLMASEIFEQLRQVLGVWKHSKTGEAGPSGMGTEGRDMEGAHFPEFTVEARLEMSRRARDVAGEISTTRRLLLSMSSIHGNGPIFPLLSSS